MYVALSNYLERSEYPRDCDQKNKTRIFRMAKKYMLDQGKLYLRLADGGIGQELLHEGNITRVLTQVHSEGHMGINNTIRRMKTQYCCPGMIDRVTKFVQSCDTCQLRSRPPRSRNEVARPIRPPLDPFVMVGCDAVGPVLPSKQGNKYLLVAVDYLTRWPIAMAVENINEITTAEFLYKKIVVEHGLPKYLLTDRGSNFTSGYVRGFLQQLGCRHLTTTAYRPQTNGLCERLNQTLVQTLAKIIKDKDTEDNWDKYVDEALFAIRCTKNDSTMETPGKLLYGYDLRSPGVWPNPREDFAEGEIVEEVADRVMQMTLETSKARGEARKRVMEKQAARKRRYDATVGPRKRFELGEQVLMKDATPQSKFADKWLGPMVVVKVNESGTYWLNGPGGRRLDGAVHGDRLRSYQARNTMIPDVMVRKAAERFEVWLERRNG